MGTDPNILPGLTLSGLSESIKECLSSEEFDPRGEMNGFPLFERFEDRARTGRSLQKGINNLCSRKSLSQEIITKLNSVTRLEGILPTLGLLFQKQLPPSISVDREHRYPSGKRCDLVFTEDAHELWIEVKLNWEKSCTNYETVYTLDEYLIDISKLRELQPGVSKIILLLAFKPTSDFPGTPAPQLTSALGYDPTWTKFKMPTESYGACICHILLWFVGR